MPTETTTTNTERRSRRSEGGGGEHADGSSGPSRTEQARATATQARNAATETGDFLFGLLDGVVEVFGGVGFPSGLHLKLTQLQWNKLDKEVRFLWKLV